MNVVFMGTPDFSCVVLKKLLSSSHRVLAVVTQPDRPKGRGLKLQPSPVKKLAQEYKLPVFQPKKLPDKELMDFLQKTNPGAIVVVAYGLKIPPDILNFPPHGCINVHASLLPKYRGASPIQWAIINGESVTGVTTMQMDEGWDTGDILLTRSVPIGPEENCGSLHDRLAQVGAELLVETLTGLENNDITPVPQNDSEATYARKLTDADFLLDWKIPARHLYNRIRAFDPWPGARTFLNGELLKIWSARLTNNWYGLEEAEPGTVGEYCKEADGIPVRAGDGVLLITELQLPGRKRLTARQFLAGKSLPPGTVLG